MPVLLYGVCLLNIVAIFILRLTPYTTTTNNKNNERKYDNGVEVNIYFLTIAPLHINMYLVFLPSRVRHQFSSRKQTGFFFAVTWNISLIKNVILFLLFIPGGQEIK